MNDNKILQAIDYLEAQKRLFPNSFNVLSGHFDTAITALQEQAEREKGCEYCKQGYDLENGDVCEPSLYISGNELIALRYDEQDSKAEINFCPKCGRDLRKLVEE